MCLACLLVRRGDPSLLEALAWRGQVDVSIVWRAFTASWVHWSDAHLHANLAGAAAVAMLGWLLRVPMAAVQAWLLAWPLTQLGLLAVATPAHHGGLSGWLHAGVAVVALSMLRPSAPRTTAARRWGWLLAAGLVATLLVEHAVGRRLVDASAGVWLTTHAHALGALAGALTAWTTHASRRMVR